jgi:hypothetical protein
VTSLGLAPGPILVRKYAESSCTCGGVTLEDEECSNEVLRSYNAVGSDKEMGMRDNDETADGGCGPTAGAFPTGVGYK